MRNRIAAKQIDELLAQREELRKVFTQTRNTHETTKEIRTGSSLPEEETLTAATKQMWQLRGQIVMKIMLSS